MKLNTQITIRSLTEGKSAMGGASKAWADFATVRANKKTLREKERFSGQRRDTETECEFLIRYLPGLSEKMRVVHDTVTYEITGLVPVDDRKRAVVIGAKRSVDGN